MEVIPKKRLYDFQSIHWRFIITISLVVFLGLVTTEFWTMTKIRYEANQAAVEKAKGDLLLGEAFLENRYPGSWTIREGKLYKGQVLINGNYEIVDEIARLTGDTCTIFHGDTRVSTNVMRDGKRAVGTKVSDEVGRVVLGEGREFFGEAEVVGVKYQTAYKPIRDENGGIIGIWYVGANKQFVDRMVGEAIKDVAYTFGLIMLIIIGIIWLLTSSLTRPINNLVGAANRLAQGNLDTSISVNTRDEIGHLARSFEQMRVELKRQYSALQKSNEMLRESERRFREMLERVQLLSVILDTEGRVTFCNDFMLRLTGWKRNDVLGRCWVETFIPTERQEYVKRIVEEVSQGVLPTDGEKAIQTRNGERRLIDWNNSLLRDSQGNIIGLARIGEDITERKRAEENLRAAHQQLVDIIEFLPDATFAVNKEQKVTAWNRAMEEMTGVRKEDIINKGDYVYAVPFYGSRRSVLIDLIFQDNPEIEQEYGQIERRENTLFTEIFVPSVYNGRGAFLWVTASPLFDNNGNLVGAIETMRDITERKQMEKQMAYLDRLDLIGEMAAGIAHEIRNPMTSVRGFLQLFGEKAELSKYKSYFDLMIQELDRGNAIITEFLSLAKGKVINLKKQDLNTIVNSLLPLIQADAATRDNYIYTDLGDIPPLLLDSSEMRQLILNLSRNGLEAMLPGGNLTIKTYDEGESVVLAVQDEGQGIPPEIIEKIGAPFFTTKDYGTGLGLAVCYRIALRHDATIKVDTGSAGTTVFVRFNFPQKPQR
ncbi:MAG: PAS domain S-box protein [Desulforudis sp.]|nr:PAS domain S-box protein [Clostridia bacterium]RJX19372.1 MAG: PAS domain S-box protein [Desulforudis sp.]